MMRLLFAAVVFMYAPFAWSGDLVSDVSPAELKAQLEGWGYEVFAHEDEEDRPQLLVSDASDLGSAERKGFAMRMMGCRPEEAMFMLRRCDGFEFRAYLTPGFPIKDKVYADWNRDVGHTRAFVKDGHPRLAWRVNLEGGVSWDHVRVSVEIWHKELAAYFDHLDASVLD